MFPDDQEYVDTAAGAAYSVAFMFAIAAAILWVMKKSGFKAMVAVGGS